MSSCFATKENVSKVAHFIATLLNHGYGICGFSAESSWYDVFMDCKRGTLFDEDMVFQSLYKLGCDKFCDEIPQNPRLRYWEVSERKMDCLDYPTKIISEELVQDWHYKVFKGIRLLHYQLENENASQDEKVVVLGKIMQSMAVFIVSNSPTYHAIEWC